MTIDEAIKILKLHTHGSPRPMDPDLDNAIDLGIEALRVIQVARASNARLVDPLLPGETEE